MDVVVVHTYPIEDLEPHTLQGGGCACFPRRVDIEPGRHQWIHNSFDGRELKEKLILGRN